MEVDFLVPGGERRLLLLEAKAAQSVTPDAARSLQRLRKAIGGYSVQGYVVHQPSPEIRSTTALCPGVRAISVRDLSRIADGGRS